MASFGKILNLLDNRYLDVQDVTGRVEPLPTLVPYDEYTQNVLVYRMDTNHEIYMALMQDFTDRTARAAGKELWTWCVQWEVKEEPCNGLTVSAPSPKRPRLDLGPLEPFDNAQQPHWRAPRIDIFERRVIDPELMQEEDVLRILIDIVQVDSTIVPNFIEFLYRWIDFYDGDGKALKAALRHEIPSLWDFEYHPLVLPEDLKKRVNEEEQAAQTKTHKAPEDSKAEELAQGSPTKKMRERPDLAAMERQTEESERLQYREVKYGIQPPKLNEPLPPLINIPPDHRKRTKYYAACFRSRQRALTLLLEAGITIPQISNYKKLQKEHPKETSYSNEGGGLRHYHKDAEAAQARYVEKEKEMALRDKHMEITISNKLAAEAQLAACTTKHDGPSGVPLIPPTSGYAKRPIVEEDILSRILAQRGNGGERINVVPQPLVGRMKSKFFEGANEKQAFSSLGRPGGRLLNELALPSRAVTSEDDDTDIDEVSMNTRDQPDYRPPPIPPVPQPLLPPARLLPSSVTSSTSNPPQTEENVRLPTALPASGTSSNAVNMTEYMQNLSPDQAQRLVPLLDSDTRQKMASALTAGHSDAAFGPSTSVQAETPHTSSSTQTNPLLGAREVPYSSLPPIPPLPPLPMLPRLPIIATTLAYTPSNQSTRQLAQHTENHDGYIGIPPYRRPPVTPLSIASNLPLLHPNSHRPNQETGSNSTSSLDFNSGRVPPNYPQHAQGSSQQQNATSRASWLPQLPSLPGASGLSAKILPPAFAQRILAVQRGENAVNQSEFDLHVGSGTVYNSASANTNTGNIPEHYISRHEQAPVRPSFLPPPIALAPSQTNFQANPHTHIPPVNDYESSVSTHRQSSDPFLSPLGSRMQRNAPSPLKLAHSPLSPLSSLAPSLLATSPFAASINGMPIQIYFPKVVIPGNLVGPGGAKGGDGGTVETDALLVGHSHPGSGKIVLSKAIFLPVGVWSNTLRRVRRGAYTVLESYLPSPSHPKVVNSTRQPFLASSVCSASLSTNPHHAVYQKLVQAYSLMAGSKDRERELTKRWRATPGPMTQHDRGAVWEGWGVTLVDGIEMNTVERRGALLSSGLIDEGVEKKGRVSGVDEDEVERRRREIDELMEEDSAEDENMES